MIWRKPSRSSIACQRCSTAEPLSRPCSTAAVMDYLCCAQLAPTIHSKHSGTTLPKYMNVKDLNLVVVLPEEASLTEIPARLLAPGVLPELWNGDELTLQEMYNYFSGTKRIEGEFSGESKAIPRAERSVVNEAIQAAVKGRRLWLLSGRESLLAEDVPIDLLTDDATVQAPPPPLAAKDVIPDNLPEVWGGGNETTAREIAEALTTRVGKVLPWLIVRDALDTAFKA